VPLSVPDELHEQSVLGETSPVGADANTTLRQWDAEIRAFAAAHTQGRAFPRWRAYV